MEYYYFNGGDHTKNNRMNLLESHGFSGALFTYNSWSQDFMILAARDIDISKKIKYMVAIRPYAISPQYLVMMNHSMNDIMSNRVQFNLILGHIKEHETQWGGMEGTVHDQSSLIERSNYLINYIKELDKMHKQKAFDHMPDFFVSATNEHVFNIASELNNKIILSYRDYKHGRWIKTADYPTKGEHVFGNPIDLSNKTIMVSICPIIRETQEELDLISSENRTNDTEYFTYQEFLHFINQLQSDQIKYLLIHPWSEDEEKIILPIIKELTF